jgi:hypothetical protein
MMNWKGCGRKRLWTNVRFSQNFLGGTVENYENLSQDSLYQGRDLNPRPPEEKAGVPTTMFGDCVMNVVFVFR